MGIGKKLADASMAKIDLLEGRLSGALKPVAPRREFVHGLGERIQHGNQTSLVNYFTRGHVFVLLVAGLMSLAVFLAMLVRALLVMSSRKRTA